MQAIDGSGVQSEGSAMATDGTTYFMSHASPMLLMPEISGDMPLRAFFKKFPQTVERPKAILAISAHWDTSAPTVSSMAKQDTIYDFGGFPRELYKVSLSLSGL